MADVRSAIATLPAPRHPVPPAGARPAAVLVPIFEEGGEARIILTKRPDTMPSHQGEIAFPGGKLDPSLDADLRAAALREASEEIGLDPAGVEVVAELDSLATVAGRFVLTPFVGLTDGRPDLRRDPVEVVAVFDVAISELLAAEGSCRVEHWERDGVTRPVYFFDYKGETIWGATARILVGFLELLRGPA